MIPLRVPTVEHFDFSALPLVQVREAFARLEGSTKRIYAGVQHDKWQKDEFVWSERQGKWSAFVPEPREDAFWDTANPGASPDASARHLREVAAQLNLMGATLEEFALPAEFARDDGADHAATEPLLRVASGASLVAQSSLNYAVSEKDYFPKVAVEWQLYNAQTGALTAQAGSGALGVVPDGSYVLWGSAGNEWSAIRVRVGEGVWSWSGQCYPGPGAPLYAKSGTDTKVVTAQNAGDFAFHFDPLARTVSASCVIERAVRTRNGAFDLPVGTQIIAGIRASRGGPQSAWWALHEDGTARLLAASPTFSNGACECAKTDHFASDIAQHADGTLFFLSECGLSIYYPDAPSIFERLSPFPELLHGHPGGQCLRFPGGLVCFWTENFGGVSDGKAWYNRLVRRLFGRDLSGPSTLWHGPNCAESYLGRYWAIRSEDGKTLFLDWIENGRWGGFTGLSRSTTTHFWQRLRRCNGNLWVFGYAPSLVVGEETPICSVTDGRLLRDAALPYFVRRATTCALVVSRETLLLAARAGSDGIGVANRVVEIVDGGGGTGGGSTGAQRVCSFWNEAYGAFEMTRGAFLAGGGDPDKLPPFFTWRPQPGANGGGVWVQATSAPETGYYLQLDLSGGTLIRYVAHHIEAY